MRRRFRELSVLLRAAVRANRWHTAGVLMTGVISAVLITLFSYWLKRLVDGAVHRDGRAIAFTAIGFGISQAVLGVCGWLRTRWWLRLQDETRFVIDTHLMHLSESIPTIDHHERPQFVDRLAVLRSQGGSIILAFNALTDTSMAFFTLVTSLVLLVHISPVLALLPLFGAPSLLTSARSAKVANQASLDTAEVARTAGHLFTLATTANPSKELRLFGLSGEVVDRHRVAREQWDRRLSRAAVLQTLLDGLGTLCYTAGYIGALVYVTLQAVHHPSAVSVGDVFLTISLAARMNAFVAQFAGTVQGLSSNLRTMDNYLWLIDYRAEVAQPTDGVEPVPSKLRRGIDLTDVSFRYPDTDVDVLAGISLHLPAGETIAIVGENGAGKTTLVKLLCGFYRPTHGGITVDGRPLDRLDPIEWRRRLSGAFQDFANYQFVAREVVGVGDLPLIDDGAAVAAAVTRAHADDVIASLGDGLETQLGTQFSGGTGLSEGQWQKLALARAMMRDNPLLIVLDEPTASLDAMTEHALFERYAHTARATSGATGSVTLLVSHRFSTVRMAGLIVVMNQGQVVGVGSHDELMAHGGLYAELYAIQASAYQ